MTIIKKKISIVIFSLLAFLVISAPLLNIATIYNINGFNHHSRYSQNYELLISKILIATDNYTIELISPANGSGFEIGDLITFKWKGVKDAVNYTLAIDLADNFSTPHLIIVEGLSETEYTLNTSGMQYGMWYWKITGTLEGGERVSSRIQVFYIDPHRSPPSPRPIFEMILLILAGVSSFIILAGIQHYREKQKTAQKLNYK